jgi:alkylation response protein AidB-like acyl-CoA dehydrogenase
MDLELSQQQQKLQDDAIRFAHSELDSDMIVRDAEGHFSREAWQRCADFGLLRMPIPEEYGGMGFPITDVIAVMEALGYGCRDQGLLFSLNAHLWTTSIPILLYGTDLQKQKYLKSLSDGTLIGANAASEPDAGSDIFAMKTRAELNGDHYVLNGTKMFVTNAPVADMFVAYATLKPELGLMGITAFIIDRNTPGLSVSSSIEKMGLRTALMGKVTFNDCKIPCTNRLGREGRGVELFECSMEWERGCILATCLGQMKWQLERCIDHARSRKQFGQSIGKFQSVANLIVEMKIRLETCRPLVYRIGYLKEKNLPSLMESAIAKVHVSESYVQSSLDAIRVFGGYGYLTEHEIERDLRDSVGSILYSGTSEIQRNIIARCLKL